VAFRFRRIADDNDQPTERGTYRKIRDYWADYCARQGRPNTYWAEICCPGCGRVGMVGSNHTVADDGVVTPSDVCPFDAAYVKRHELHDEIACTFHQYIELDDWARPCTPRRSPAD
jgi:hypothetical protein